MKKFGFGKKDSSGGGDDEKERSSLFGRKNKSSPAPQNENPYGQEPANDPYARPNPYQQNSGGLPSGPRGPAGRGGLPGGPGPRQSSGGPPPPYSGTPSGGGGGGGGGYGSEKYGASGGYGGNRYDDGNSGRQNSYGSGPGAMRGGSQGGGYGSQAPARKGGYGGMGGDDAGGREALFAGADSRYAQKQQSGYGGGQQGGGQDSYDGYGAQRELTEEEQEQQELRNTTGEIKRVQQDSIQTLQRTEDTLDRAIEVGMGTYQKLAQQHDRLANTEKNLDLAMEQSRHGSQQADELKHLNRSLWNPGMRNPMRKDSSKAVQEARAAQQYQQDRNIRADTRANAYAGHEQMQNKMNEIQEAQGRGRLLGSGAGKRKDLQFEFEEDDEERNELENNEGDIDERMDRLGQKLGVVRMIAGAQGEAVAASMPMINRIDEKTVNVDDAVSRNNRKLDKFK